jgi:predicted AAA+ superfamily ATPase
VGKTWVMKEFGKTNFERVLYVNFERDKLIQDLFEKDFDLMRILLALQVQTGVVPEPGKTLLIFDEIQEAKGGLTALKYFHENAPEYHVIGAGSLLGIALSKQSFPVGMIDFLELHPMSFSEFLTAMGENDLLGLLKSHNWSLIKTFRDRYSNLLKQYYFVGGMPEAVDFFVKEKNFEKTRTIQKNILMAYEQDFSKHAPAEIVPRLRLLWNSVPSQLSKENKKFIYGLVKEGARAREYEAALLWIEDYGLVHRVNRLTKAGFPLKSYVDFKAFKIYVLDIGLLCALSGLSEKILLDGDKLFTEFKGALTEQYVLQQLISEEQIRPHYWSEERSTGEVDFLIEKDNRFYPVEVKAEENLQAKSLKFFHAKFQPQLSIRTSLSDFRQEDWLVNIPLYAIREVLRVV